MEFRRQKVALNRRSLIKAGSVVGAAVAAGGVRLSNALAQQTTWIYYLDPDCRTDQETCDHPTDIRRNPNTCNTCNACISHAHNKRWATEEDVRRAHDCCRCSIKRSRVRLSAFDAMFGTGDSFSPEFDLRWQE